MTRSRAVYGQGNVVLVRFVYTDEAGAKRRPAVILSTGDYHRGRQEVTQSRQPESGRQTHADHQEKCSCQATQRRTTRDTDHALRPRVLRGSNIPL